jgi:hypothetical protein
MIVLKEEMTMACKGHCSIAGPLESDVGQRGRIDRQAAET